MHRSFFGCVSPALILTPLSVMMFHAYGVFSLRLPAVGENDPHTVASSVQVSDGFISNTSIERRTAMTPGDRAAFARDSVMELHESGLTRAGKALPRYIPPASDIMKTTSRAQHDHVMFSPDAKAVGRPVSREIVIYMNALVMVIWSALSLFSFIKIVWGCAWIENLRRTSFPRSRICRSSLFQGGEGNECPSSAYSSEQQCSPIRFSQAVLRPRYFSAGRVF